MTKAVGLTGDLALARDGIEQTLREYGYKITSEPLRGQERQYVEHLNAGAEEVIATAFNIRRRYGYRGRSKNMLAALHRDLPTPCFGICLTVKAQEVHDAFYREQS